jgi:hypothetical protein
VKVWECRSRIARNLIARRCLLAFQVGLLRFLSLAWLCLLALLGLAVRDASLQRWGSSSKCYPLAILFTGYSVSKSDCGNQCQGVAVNVYIY